MPVARGEDRQMQALEQSDAVIQRRHDGVSIRNRQPSARQEIVLNVDDDQRIAELKPTGTEQTCGHPISPRAVIDEACDTSSSRH
jgi:hypothetical protein